MTESTNGPFWQFVSGPSRDCHRPWLGGVPELTVTSDLARPYPTIFFQFSDDLSHLHETAFNWAHIAVGADLNIAFTLSKWSGKWANFPAI